jgi:hypothetical protein
MNTKIENPQTGLDRKRARRAAKMANSASSPCRNIAVGYRPRSERELAREAAEALFAKQDEKRAS